MRRDLFQEVFLWRRFYRILGKVAALQLLGEVTALFDQLSSYLGINMAKHICCLMLPFQ